jgi:tetratricopeptide (TPR) repeat protein
MKSTLELKQLAGDGKTAFESARYELAAELFRSAAQGYAALRDAVNAAEQQNNLSVTLLKLGRSQEALDAALGTDEVFAAVHDVRRQGMALNNQAAAFENLGRRDAALSAYERSAPLLGEAGEKEMRAVVLKAAAGLQLRRGKLADSGLRMIGVLEAREHPSFFERLLKYLLRLVQR